MLVVHNREHLEALETWLGAEHRQRGPVAGLTMMARLPRWMKAARAREDVLKALAELREQAQSEGLW
jgi:predicted RecB family nuclease